MAYDLEEQEQLANLKAFWNQYGNLISWIAIAGLSAYAAYNYYNYHQRSKSGEASGLYMEQLRAFESNDKAKIERITADIESKYGSTAYGPMAALTAAKYAFEANDLKTAKTQLAWAIEHGNAEYKSVAKLRLSGVLLDEKAYDEALKTISADMLPQFEAEVADRKGDILVAQNKIAEARAAYQQALDKMDKKHPGRALVQVKLDSIGGTPAAKAAA